MLDNELIKLFLPIIQNGLAAEFPDVVIKQAYQPTQQGINTVPTVYFYKIGDKRYGTHEITDVWNEGDEEEVHTESQQYETTFQISALVLQDVNNTNSYTASDLVNRVSYIMQSDATLATLWAQNVGILRVTDVLNPYFMDDRDQFEASPSFTFTLTHLQTISNIVPVVELKDEIVVSI